MIGTRIFVYVWFRLHRLDKTWGSLKITDKIEPKNIFIMGIEELTINILLLCYLYGINGSVKQDDDKVLKETILNDDIEGHYYLRPSGQVVF
jgi:hypothetical protein